MDNVLTEASWRERQARHEARVDRWVEPHLARRRAGRKHPVEDFLFTYYGFRPAALRRWHPGPGVVLAGASPLRSGKGYVETRAGVMLDPAFVAGRRDAVRRTRDVLVATRDRPPAFGCLGLHEWAMVYRQTPEQVRHAGWPLRLGARGTDAVVEAHRIRCTHFDAFRFFTPQARPLNTVQPLRREDLEQPGCLHTAMDLYRWSYRLSPLVPSELVADCFELAREIRVLDMRASPYDLTDLGYDPVRIETVDGKHEYVEAQRRLAARGTPLRQRLIDECERLGRQPASR